MKKFYFAILFFSIVSTAKSQHKQEQKIKLFVDCSNAYCDMDYFKTQIKFVDYTPDNKAADVDLLITQQGNGGGGSQYQLIFYGQNNFHTVDTLRFSTKSTNTSFEIRDLMVKYIQLGLIPLLSKTKGIEKINIQIKDDNILDSNKKAQPADAWNYWVFRVGVSGNLSTDANYKSFNYSGYVTSTRITDKLKVTFSMQGGNRNDTYNIFDGTNTSKIVVKNETADFQHQIAKSISEHWSIGYDLGATKSSFYNYKLKTYIRPAIEYNFFKYKDVNNKLFTIRYGLDVSHSEYFDTTIFLKKRETLPGQQLDAALTYNQKWGTVNLFTTYHAFLNNLKRYDLNIGGGVSVRISGGLSFNVYVFGNNLRDQIYLPKGEATFQDVLTKQRQLATNFSLFSFFGITYRFGSKLNNFVNPRFNSSGGNFSY